MGITGVTVGVGTIIADASEVGLSSSALVPVGVLARAVAVGVMIVETGVRVGVSVAVGEGTNIGTWVAVDSEPVQATIRMLSINTARTGTGFTT